MSSLYQITKGLLAFGLYVSSAAGASLQQVTNWGSNPSNLASMHIYVPDRLAANPAIILALHPCGGTGSQMYSMTQLPRSADTLGFIMIFPSTTKQSNCWEVNTAATLLHEGGGDSQGVVNMVKYALNKYSGDPNRVYMVGASSGAMMTNVLAATYPDVFEAGAAWSGTPAMCWKGEQSSSPGGPGSKDCANGLKRYSAQEWGDLARSGYPGYTGRRTRMMLTHGTADTLTVYPLLAQELAQWSNVLGVSFTRNVTNSPTSNWVKMEYGDATKLVGYSVNGGGHIPPFQEAAILAFFGLTGGSSSTTSRIVTTTAMTTGGQTTEATTTPATTPVTTPATTRTTSASGAQQTKWGQCGGLGWTGATTCVSGSTCRVSNNWYSQCL